MKFGPKGLERATWEDGIQICNCVFTCQCSLGVDVPHIEASNCRMSLNMLLEPKGVVRKQELLGRMEARYVVVCLYACSVHSVLMYLTLKSLTKMSL